MSSKHEPSAEKKALVDTLLALDSRLPTKSAEGREVAERVLRSDRRRVRILTWMTISFFLLTVLGICGSVYWYSLKVIPSRNMFQQIVNNSVSEIHKLEPDMSKFSPQTNLTLDTAIECSHLYQIQLANLGGTMALFVVMLAAAFCTTLLIRASRAATLRQIQTSLLMLSEQIESMRQTVQPNQPTSNSQT